MRDYLYLANERIESIYNQLVSSTPVETIREELNKKGNLSDWKYRLEAGFMSFIKGEASHSKSTAKEQTFMESIRSRVELEQKVGLIEQRIDFVDIEALIAGKEPLIGLAVSFTGAYYSKGLKNPSYYSSSEWDGSLPFLHRKVENKQLKIVYSPIHFTSQSPWALVHGMLKIDGIGFVVNDNDTETVISPVAYGIFISEAIKQILDN
jgi:hypothetical protein